MIKREDHEKEDKRIILYICVYLLAIPQMFNYVLGQINLYITFLILLSLYIYLKYEDLKWEFIASLILGISIIIKPTTFFMVLFLIIIKYDKEKKEFNFDMKTSLIRIIGALLPLASNIIFFLIYPDLLSGFIETNLTRQTFVELNFSISITRLLINFSIITNISISQLGVYMIVTMTFWGIAYFSHVIGKFERNYMIYGYLLGILIMFLGYFDTWDHHLLNIIPILIILIFNLPRQSEITNKTIKPTLFFLSFFDLLFMGIYLLTEPFFPFNFASTIFLIITFYVITVSSLKSKPNDIRGG